MNRPLWGLLAAVALLAGCASTQAPAAGVDLGGAKKGDAACSADGDGKCADKTGCTPDSGCATDAAPGTTQPST